MIDEQTPEFTDVYLSASTLWARRWWLVAGVILGALLAGAFVFTQPDTNRSWAQVLIRPLGLDLTRGSANTNNAIDAVTERELAQSFIVAEQAAERLNNGLSARELRQEVDITGVERSPVLEFSYANADATIARDVAQAFAESYLDIRADIAVSAIDTTRQSLTTRRADVGDQLGLVNEEIGSLTEDDTALRAALSTQSVLSSQLAQLSNDIALLDSLTTDPGVVMSPAQLAQSSERPRAIPITGAGAVLGGMLGLFAALFADRSDRERELGERELGNFGMAPLAHIPRLSAGTDAYAGLENRLGGAMGSRYQVLAITTLSGGGHPAQIAGSLGLSMAQTGRKILLISADFESHTVSRQLGLSTGPGLLEALISGRAAGEMVQHSGQLDVITAGDGTADPASLLRMVGLRRLLGQARTDYDMIILSAPNLLADEASVLTTWAADAVALVVDTDDRRGEVEQAAEVLRRTDAEVIGSIVLTDTSV